jgi:hypothetical protein
MACPQTKSVPVGAAESNFYGEQKLFRAKLLQADKPSLGFVSSWIKRFDEN